MNHLYLFLFCIIIYLYCIGLCIYNGFSFYVYVHSMCANISVLCLYVFLVSFLCQFSFYWFILFQCFSFYLTSFYFIILYIPVCFLRKDRKSVVSNGKNGGRTYEEIDNGIYNQNIVYKKTMLNQRKIEKIILNIL